VSALGEVLAPVITIAGSGLLAYVTARTARQTQQVVNQGQVEQAEKESRLASEDKAYERAQSYLQQALDDARRELDETRQELAEERQQRRDETGMLNLRLAGQQVKHERQIADLRREMQAVTARAERAETAARQIARRAGQPEPDF
jgi:vacuolar-type H+-ATPase subunit I/STV1